MRILRQQEAICLAGSQDWKSRFLDKHLSRRLLLRDHSDTGLHRNKDELFSNKHPPLSTGKERVTREGRETKAQLSELNFLCLMPNRNADNGNRMLKGAWTLDTWSRRK